MRPRTRDAILFDLDGTLVDSAIDIAHALSVLRVQRGVDPIAAAAVRSWISLGVDALVANALGPCATETTDDVAAFRTVLRGLPSDPACLYSGVAAVLDDLAADGRALGIVTNKPEALSRKLLAELGLADRFAVIVGGDTVAYGKPHPAPVHHALDALDALPDEAWFVGDSEVDAAAASAAGVRFLLYTKGYGADACRDHDIHARFDAFADLPALLRSTGV